MSINTKDKNWFIDIYDDFREYMQELTKEIIDWAKDIALDIFELVIQGVVFAVSTIPVPDFLTDGIDTLTGGLPPSVLWLLGQTGFSQGLAIFGAGVMFRMTRKVITLGQW